MGLAHRAKWSQSPQKRRFPASLRNWHAICQEKKQQVKKQNKNLAATGPGGIFSPGTLRSGGETDKSPGF
jgi:hypothetical protein